MEKKMENDMETGILKNNIGDVEYILGLHRVNGKENGNYHSGLQPQSAN